MKLLPLRPRRSASPPPHDFRVDCELCRHWGLSRRTGAKQNCAGGVEERRGRSRFFAGAKQNGAGAKQNGGGEEEGVSRGCCATLMIGEVGKEGVDAGVTGHGEGISVKPTGPVRFGQCLLRVNGFVA
ncbi:hypothetical protein Bbelb_312870 [Branchiostoma belcheri]|nr:hypothetical protein Bbelb_312870 [Branchiostoma belcheri]